MSQAYGDAISPVEANPQRKKILIIVAIVVLVLLCCCCLGVVGGYYALCGDGGYDWCILGRMAGLPV